MARQPTRVFRGLFRVLLIVLVCVLSILLVMGSTEAKRGIEVLHAGETTATAAESLADVVPLLLLGGGDRKTRALESENLVVDTLNLTHWLQRRAPLKKVETCDILTAIENTAPILRRQYPGRVVYVTKDRETRKTKASAERLRALYQTTARRCKVYVNVVERLPDASRQKKTAHASLGRDDFYLIMLAWKYNCPVLSRDRFRDLDVMRSGDLDSFHVYSYSPVKALPERDFVNPAAAEFRRMRRPAAVDYSVVLPHL